MLTTNPTSPNAITDFSDESLFHRNNSRPSVDTMLLSTVGVNEESQEMPSSRKNVKHGDYHKMAPYTT
jgi:hypothetical protein